MSKYEDPTQLDYRYGGDTVDDFAQKYMKTVAYIFSALNELRSPTGGTLTQNPEAYQLKVDDNKLYIRNQANTDWILLGDVQENFGFRTSASDAFMHESDVADSGTAGKLIRADASGKLNADILGNAAKIADKAIQMGLDLADEDRLVYDKDTDTITNRPLQFKVDGDKIYARKDATTSWVLLGDLKQNLGFRDSTDDAFLTEADVADSGTAGKLIRADVNGKLNTDILGNARKMAGKTFAPEDLQDGQIPVYRTSDGTWHAENKGTVGAGKNLMIMDGDKMLGEYNGDEMKAIDIQKSSLTKALAESTGYGIVSGCEPSINGLTVTVSAGVIHTADGRRVEVPEQSITLDVADATKPRTDVVYLDKYGKIAKLTGEIGTSTAPGLMEAVIKVGEIAIKAGAVAGAITASYNHYKTATITYHNVSMMRQDRTLMPGMVAHTLGYYAPNDGGGAVYIIRQKKENDVDDGGSTLVLDNENVAELLIDGDINVKQFGAYGNGTDNDTDAFTKAISFASSDGHNILIPHGKYNITTIEIPDNVSLYGFGASIYSESELTFDIKSNASANRSFIDNINFYAKNPITIETGRKVTINECSFYNLTGTGINLKNGYEHDIRNCDFYGLGTNCIAIRMAAGDSRIDNCIMIDCYVGIKVVDKSCYISNVHAWIGSPSLLRGSLMFDFGESNIFINQCCCDTYHYVFKKKGYNRVVFNELYVINNYGIWTQEMNADEENILTSTSDLNYLVSVKMIGCNIPMKIKTNDANDILPIFIDDTSYAPYIYAYISDITYDTTLAEKTNTSKVIIKGNVMVINIACKLLKNTKSMQKIGSMTYPAGFNNTIVFTGVVCATEISEPVGIAYMRIVNNQIYVSTSEDYTGKFLLASTTIYTSKL